MGINLNDIEKETLISSRRSNPSAIPRSSILGKVYYAYNLRALLEYLPYPFNRYLLNAGSKVKPLIFKNTKYSPMSSDVRGILFNLLKKDIAETEKLLGIDLSFWKKR